jgi:NTE family protein
MMTTGATGRIDAVFEGGGVKGIALAGAVSEAMRRGHEFVNVAGTSAGAIMASLVASGFGPGEIEQVLKGIDFQAFCDRSPLDRLPLLGPVLSVAIDKGIYEGVYFERWIGDLLATKGVRTFRDLVIPEYADDERFRYRLQVIATDLTHGEMLVLPRDAGRLGVEPDDLEVAAAVRMSMSIPYFFEPVTLTAPDGSRTFVVDGGVLSNFPVWLLDDDSADPPWPTIGFKLVAPDEDRPARIDGPFSMLVALASTMIEAHDRLYIEESDFARTIAIDTLGVRTTDFDITPERRDALFDSGVAAARKFFDQWDFAGWTRCYRQGPARTRRDLIRARTAAAMGDPAIAG